MLLFVPTTVAALVDNRVEEEVIHLKEEDCS